MATGDILSVTARADGWSADVKIEGFTTGATYDFGTPGAVGTSKFYINVTSEGYDATGVLGTIARVVYGTTEVRKPYPNEASTDETVSGSDIIVRVALSEEIYNDDTISSVVIASAWATNTGGASQTSNAYNSTATMSSTLDYPVAFGQWDEVAGVCTKERVKSDFVMAFNAFHGHGIACVKFTATGVTSSHAQTATVTTQTATQRSATSLYMSAYQATIPLSGFTQGETITLRAQVYPIVGDADSIQDTNGRTTDTNECLGYNEPTIICDKNNALDVIRYVSSTGNDTTGDGSSGNPWLTVAKAYLTATVNVVKLMGTGTTYNLGTSGTRRTTSEWIVVEPDTGATPTVQLTTTTTYRCQRLCIRNCTVTLSGSSAYLDGEAVGNFLWYDGCTFSYSGSTPSVCSGYRSDLVRVTNSTGLSRTKWELTKFSNARMRFHFDGVDFDAEVGKQIPVAFRVVACFLDGQQILDSVADANNPNQDNFLYCCNKHLNFSATGQDVLQLGEAAALTNVAIVGNVCEKTGGTSDQWSIFSDSQVYAATHVVISHNTVLGSGGGSSGQRVNWFYNDTGTSAVNHKYVFARANYFSEVNIKSDTFGTANGNRIGNWPQLYGVNFIQNALDGSSSSSFDPEYWGVGNNASTPVFEDSANDDYAPDATDTVLKGGATALAHLTYDLLGTQRGATYDRGAINTTSAEILGDFAATLDAATLSATGAVDVAGASTPTLDAIGLSAAGVVDVVGAADATLENISISSAGVVDVSGSATPTLETIALSMSGVVDVSGALSATLDDLTVDAETESDTPEHTVAVTVYGPSRSVSVYGPAKSITIRTM